MSLLSIQINEMKCIVLVPFMYHIYLKSYAFTLFMLYLLLEKKCRNKLKLKLKLKQCGVF